MAKLFNVRLDDARVRKARALRARGVPLADVVREAIDLRYGELTAEPPVRDIDGLVRSIYDEHPDPPGLPPRTYDVHDRRAAADAIRRKVGRRQHP